MLRSNRLWGILTNLCLLTGPLNVHWVVYARLVTACTRYSLGASTACSAQAQRSLLCKVSLVDVANIIDAPFELMFCVKLASSLTNTAPRQLFELLTKVRGVIWGQVCIVAHEPKGANPYCLLVCLLTHLYLLLSTQINKFVHNRRGNDRNCGVLYIRHVTYQKWAIPLLRGRIPTLRYYPMPIARFCIRLSTYNAHAYIFIPPITPPNVTVPVNVP